MPSTTGYRRGDIVLLVVRAARRGDNLDSRVVPQVGPDELLLRRAPCLEIQLGQVLACYRRFRSNTMDVTIPKSLEDLVRRKVDEGLYSTEEEVVGDALRLMQARDEATDIKRARLQDAIERGYADIAAGRVIRLENDDQIDAFFADL